MLDRRRGWAEGAAWARLLVLPQLAWALRSRDVSGLPPAPQEAQAYAPDLLRSDTFCSPNCAVAPGSPEDPAKTALAHSLHSNFDRLFAKRVDDVFASLNSSAVLTISGHVERLFVNFLLNLQSAAETSKNDITVVNALLDTSSLETCRQLTHHRRVRRLHIHCIDLVGMIPIKDTKGKPSGGSFLWTKPVVLRQAVAASRHGVLLADLDVVFYQNLLPHAQRQWDAEPGTVLITGTEWGTCCNTGTVFAKGQQSLHLLDAWVESNNHWYERHLGDQDALLELAFFNFSALDIYNGFKPPFPADLIGKGRKKYSLGFFNESIVVEQGRKCRGCQACRGPCDKGKIMPFANHYNKINMHIAPEHTLDASGNWSEDVDEFVGKPALHEVRMMEAGDWCELHELEGLLSGGPEAGFTGGGSTAKSSRGGVWRREEGQGIQR